MKQTTLDEFRLALASRINVPILAYLEERLADIQTGIVDATEDRAVREQQGRAREIRDLIKTVKTVRE